jgi:hypothetical protein
MEPARCLVWLFGLIAAASPAKSRLKVSGLQREAGPRILTAGPAENCPRIYGLRRGARPRVLLAGWLKIA